MKNLYYILLSIIVCGYMASCDDNGYDTPAQQLVVTKSEVIFEALGGSSSVEVSSPNVISATVNKNWCTLTLSGNKITVSVAENASIEGRNATIEIKSGSETVYVSVAQSGFISDFRIPESVRVSMGGDVLEYYAQSDFPVDISIDVPWITYELVDGKLVLTVAESAVMQSGTVTVTTTYILNGVAKTKVQTLVINQDIPTYTYFVGNWKLSYINIFVSETTRVELNATISAVAGQPNVLALVWTNPTYGSQALLIDYSVVNENAIFTMGNEQRQPDISTYYVYARIFATDTYFSNLSAYTSR